MVKFRINWTLRTGEVRNLAYQGGENVYLFFWFTIVESLVSWRLNAESQFRVDLKINLYPRPQKSQACDAHTLGSTKKWLFVFTVRVVNPA